MKTLNQIKKILMDWFNAHGEINSVYYLSDDDYNALRDIKYKSVNIMYQDSNINGNFIQHNYEIEISDMAEYENSDMEDEIHSDCLLIVDDLFTYLENSFDFELVATSNISSFVDDTADRTAGVQFSIRLQTERRQNICDTPTK